MIVKAILGADVLSGRGLSVVSVIVIHASIVEAEINLSRYDLTMAGWGRAAHQQRLVVVETADENPATGIKLTKRRIVMRCPKCGKVIVEVKEDLNIEGKCNNCKEVVMTPEQLKEILNRRDLVEKSAKGKLTETNKGSNGRKISKGYKLKGEDTKEGSSLIPLADIRPPKNKKEAKDLNAKLVRIKEDIDASYFTMGSILQVFYDEESFKLLGYESFRGYVDNALGFGWRKATYLIGIAEAFGEKGLVLSEKQRAGIEWSKMRELASLFKKGLLNQENLDEWLRLAKTLGTRELNEKIKEARGSAPTKDDDKMITFSLKLFTKQYDIIKGAMTEADNLMESESPGFHLEMICAEFLGGLEKPKMRLNKLLESIERIYGIKITWEPLSAVKTAGEKKPSPEKIEGKKKEKTDKGSKADKKPAPSKKVANPDKGSKKESGKKEDNGLPYEE